MNEAEWIRNESSGPRTFFSRPAFQRRRRGMRRGGIILNFECFPAVAAPTEVRGRDTVRVDFGLVEGAGGETQTLAKGLEGTHAKAAKPRRGSGRRRGTRRNAGGKF